MKINGNLVFNALGLSEAQNFVIERLSDAPTHQVSEKGRMYFNTTSNAYFFNNGTTWVGFATGGDATALQTEVDAIEASLGSFVGSNGVFSAAALDALGNVSGSTSLMSALTQLDAAITSAAAADALTDLSDVTISGAATGQFLQKSAGDWVNHTLVTADVSDITATFTELNILDGATVTAAELNILDGATLTTAELNILAGATLTTTELNYVDGVTSPIQTQLNNKQPLDATLTSLAAYNTNGILVQTAADTFDGRTITGTAGNVVVTNGSGVGGNPTLDLGTVSQAASGNFVKVTLDGFGRVTGNTAVLTADVTALVDGTYVNTTGDTMSGNLNMGTNQILGLAAPTLDTDAVNKAYVDSALTGLSWKNAVRVATTAAGTLASDFSNGDVVDGVTLVTGNRILIKNQAAAAENGIYIVTAGAPTRASDMSDAVEFDGAAVFVQEGTLNANNGYTQIATVTTVDTSAVTFSQFSGGSVYTWGTGLVVTGNTVDINLGAGIAQLPSDEVGIDLYSPTGGALILTEDGTTDSTGTAAKLHLQLDSTTLTQGAAGLKVATSGITSNELATSSVTTAKIADGEVTNVKLAVDAVSTGKISNNAVTANKLASAVAGLGLGIDASSLFVNVDNSSIEITTDTLNVKALGITDAMLAGSISNAKLSNSSITVAGDATSDAVSLGETLTVAGGTGIDTSIAANTLTVTLNATIDNLSDVDMTGVATGDLLIHNGTNMVPRHVYFLYSGASSTTHTVTHNIGQKYCNVTVVDGSDEVVIPQSITFTDSNSLVVTFNASIACKVVVMGV